MTEKDKQLIAQAEQLANSDWDIAFALAEQADSEEARHMLKTIGRQALRGSADAGHEESCAHDQATDRENKDQNKIAMQNEFANNELCDGTCCVVRDECARYMGNVDPARVNPYIVFNRRPWDSPCPHYLDIPNENYPSIHPTEV